ncbi:MAG: hypothetical protein UIL37_06640 [Clostridia bacterium]|nr:hypothetical protein [Clostridia bacterium]
MQINKNDIFKHDITTNDEHIVYPCVRIDKTKHTVIETIVDNSEKARLFADEINGSILGDFEKKEDKMCHVSTFCFAEDKIYVSYYANTSSDKENPNFQTARLAYAPINDMENKTIIDIMSVGDDLGSHKVLQVYDTILMQKNDEPDIIYILWTALIDDQYYRLYRIFNIKTEQLGDVKVNRFKVCDTVNDFSTSGIKNALACNGMGYKAMRSDIGIMQKLTTRTENGLTYYYTGAYSGNFNCIIKSTDLITWEYVAQPDEGEGAFQNDTLWENAVYVLNDKVYYFVRQWQASHDENGNPLPGDNRNEWGSDYAILTCYDLLKKAWEKPVLVGDSQSRSDFILFRDELYLFHAPTDRNHIGILKIDTNNIENSTILLQADMKGSCFYPFIQYDNTGEKLCMSYTVDRKHIRISSFSMEKYI